jgi:hypothetical protein
MPSISHEPPEQTYRPELFLAHGKEQHRVRVKKLKLCFHELEDSSGILQNFKKSFRFLLLTFRFI